MIKNIFSKTSTHLFLLFCIAVALPLIWLPSKKIIAGGDVGIPMLSPQKAFEAQSYAWSDAHATGNSYANIFTAESFYLFFSILDKAGITPDLTQKLLFMIIIFGGSVSIYFLAREFSFSKLTALLAALFYIFNLTSLSVWQRGIHNAMLMMLLAPLSFLILVWGVKRQKYISILFINIVSFLLSYVFGALGYIFSLWLLWILYLLAVLITDRKDKVRRKFIATYFVILFLSWIGTNAWWMVYLLSASTPILNQFSAEELRSRGSDVLVGLRPFLGAETILRGMSKFYHYYIKDWGNIYLNPFLIILSWVPTLIIFSTTLVKENYKSFVWRFLIILTVIILVISKGANAPFGLLNKIPYDLFTLLAPLRNPYEKVGILLAIPFSLLFALGAYQILNRLKKGRKSFLTPIVILTIISCLTVLVWPLWLGKLFVSNYKKYAVSIPSYYTEANNWLKEKVAADNARILHLPLSWGESIDYDWDYTGVEPSQYFFNGSSIGYQIGVGGVDDRIRDLLLSIHNQNTENIQKSFASLNIGWIVIHNETLYRDRILEPPDRINQWLAAQPYFLEKVIDFGPLSVWKVKDQYRSTHLYTSRRLTNFIETKKGESLDIWDEIETGSDDFVTDIQSSDYDSVEKLVSKNIVFPTKNITYKPLNPINEELGLKNMAAVNFLPDSLLYPLVNFKEYLLFALNQIDATRGCFLQSGKRLKEAALLSRQNKFTKTNESLVKYLDQLNKCSKISKDVVMADLGPIQRDFILGQLVIQRAVLETEFNQTQVFDAGDKAKVRLVEYMADLGIIPRFNPLKPNNDKQRVIFSYQVPQTGDFAIKLLKPTQDLIRLSPKIIQIDNSLVDLAPVEVNEKYIKYPSFNFKEGFHEIQFEIEPLKNLLDTQIESKKVSSDPLFKSEVDPVTQKPVFAGKAVEGPISLAFNLPTVEVGQNYELNFDVLLSQGATPFLTIVHDNDPFDRNGAQIPAVKSEIAFDDYSVDWKNVKVKYSPVLNATTATVSFTVIPWNDCFASFSFEQCQNFGMFNKVDRPSEAKFKNISLTESFNHDLILEQIKDNALKLGRSEVSWKKINPTLYEANLNNQNLPYLLTFSESYHPSWKILDVNGKVIDLPHFTMNGFANGWLVEKPLPDKIRVEFVLQNFRNTGIAVSVVSLLLMIGIIIYLDSKRRSNE